MISLSLNSVQTLDNFLKILILSIRVQLEDEVLDKQTLTDSRIWLASALKFTNEFGIPKSNVTHLYKQLTVKPSDEGYSEVYEFVDFFRAEIMDTVIADMDVPRERLKLLKDVVTCVIRQSDAALNRIVKSISILGDPAMSRIYVAEVSHDQRTHRNELDVFCRKFFKKPFDSLTIEDRNELRENNPDAYKKFLLINRKINEVLKTSIMAYVRASGKNIVPVSEMKRFLAKKDINNRLPDFKGFVDETGALYNELGVKLNGNVTGRIEMNPAYNAKTDNTYVFNHYPLFGNGQPQRIYTVNYKQSKTNDKFDVVDKLSDTIEVLRKRWIKDIFGDTTDRKTLCALIVELIYLTSGRIGSKTGATGISSLMVKEFSDKAAGHFTFTYKGKKGVKQQHKIKLKDQHSRKLLGVLQHLASGKKPSDYLITTPRGRVLTSTMITKYLRSIGAPEGTTVHKFRHVRGTHIAKEVMASCPKKIMTGKESELNKWFMDAMKRVGEELGHISGDKVTATTALVNYIDPRAVEEWYKKVGVRPNATVQKIIDKMKKDSGD